MKTQKEMFEIFNRGDINYYEKFATAQARLAVLGEKIQTIINGELETNNIVKEPSAIIKGPLGEEYIISLVKFHKLYEGKDLTSDLQVFKSKGKVFGILYEGENIDFLASWGERMILNSGDMLVTANKEEAGDVYRIEKEAFLKTYRKIDINMDI